MAFDSILQTGSFTSDGTAKTLKIRSDVDKIVIENQSQWIAVNNGYGFRYTWYRDMGTTALMEYHPAADHTVAVNSTASAVELIDSSNYALGSVIATTAGTDAVQPVYSTGDTSDIVAGSIVRLISTDHNNLNGLDFSVNTIVDSTSFKLANALATAPGRIAGTGSYRLVAPNLEVYNLFTPGNRNIANISQAASAVVTTLVDHGYAIGQRVKFNIPSVSGMIELNGLTGNVTAVTDSTFTVDVNSSGFSAFTFPVYTDVPFTPASVVPQGDNPAASNNQTSPGAFYNQGFIGIVLSAGTTSPAGNNTDVIRWTAYKAELVDDE